MVSLRSFPIAVVVGAVFAGSIPQVAYGQIAPGGGQPPPQQKPEDKPEGAAEQAPKTAGALPTTPILPPPKGAKKKFHLFDIDGYFRFRGDWMKDFALGFDDTPGEGGAPFPRGLACGSVDGSCRDKIKSANIRLRLEPTINLSERASVHAQIDVLDNLVLGSTAEGRYIDGTAAPGNAPISAFSGTQLPPQAGRNSASDGIVVKRVWAEINTPLGLLKFGRMPSHWGLGILENSGSHDPIHDTYDLDSDYGDTVDRVYFSTLIPGTRFLGGIGIDWGSSGPSADQIGITSNRNVGPNFDLDDTDDVNQFVFVISRIDSPKEFADKVASGDLVLNYGGYLAYRDQGSDIANFAGGMAPPADSYFPRDATLFIPDAWGRMAIGELELEVELTGVFGSIGNHLNGPDVNDETLKVRQFGGVARVGYGLLEGDLNLKFELGFASGDDFDNNPEGATHFSNAQIFPADITLDDSITSFIFDPAYVIDMILFRELLGAVRNATYVRPSARYDVTSNIVLNGAAIASFANKQVSTPGNGSMYGIEFNLDLAYKSEMFEAGLAYGILFPLSALDHPASPASNPNAFSFGMNNIGDADTAQTIQSRLVLKF